MTPGALVVVLVEWLRGGRAGERCAMLGRASRAAGLEKRNK